MNNPVIFMPFSVTSLFAYHVADKNGIETLCFIDNNTDKQNFIYRNVKVLNPNDAAEQYPKAAVCITSLVYAKDMKEQLARLGFDNFIPFENIARLSTDLSEANEIIDEGYTDVFPEMKMNFDNPLYQIRQNVLPEAISRLDNPTLVENMILSVTERCTLKCRDCANTMQYYAHPEDYPIEAIKRDIDLFFNAVDYVICFGIVGGEPLLYPHLTEVIEHLGKYRNKVGEVQLITNGMIVPKSDLLSALKRHNMRVFISIYDNFLSKIDKIKSVCNEHGLECLYGDKRAWIDGGKIIDGEKREDADIQYEYENCINKLCRVLMNGMFTVCPFIAGAFKLDAIADNPEDYVILETNMPKSVIRNYLKRDYAFPACRFCSGFRWGDGRTIGSTVQTKEPLPYTKRK